MRTLLLLLISAFVFVACVTSGAVSARSGPDTSLQLSDSTCPAGSERAYDMVENFLTNPNLSDARQETGTTGLSHDQIQLVQDKSICQQLNTEFSNFTDDYVVSYYKAGSFYFATQILKQPDNPDQVISGLMMIYVLDSSLNFIKGYSG